MTRYVDNVILDFDGTIIFANSFSPKDEMPTEVVKAMTPNRRALGYTQGIPDFEFSCEIPMPPGGHEVDFFGWMKAGREFALTANYVDGKYKTYTECRITSLEQGAETGKGVNTKLSAKALDANEG